MANWDNMKSNQLYQEVSSLQLKIQVATVCHCILKQEQEQAWALCEKINDHTLFEPTMDPLTPPSPPWRTQLLSY